MSGNMQGHIKHLEAHLVADHCTCGAESFVRDIELHPPECVARRVVKVLAVQLERDGRAWREAELEVFRGEQ